jgi:hypothetical protein
MDVCNQQQPAHVVAVVIVIVGVFAPQEASIPSERLDLRMSMWITIASLAPA